MKDEKTSQFNGITEQRIELTRRTFLSHPAIYRAQKVHFYLMDILPLVLTLISIPILVHLGIGWLDLGVFAFMWFLTAVGVELGFHRLFSHKAFTATPSVKFVLAFLTHIAGQGTITSWAATHRHHHAYSDSKADTHSPYDSNGKVTFKTFIRSHILWKLRYPYPNPNLYLKDLLTDKTLRKFDRFYFVNVLLGILLPGVIAYFISGQNPTFLAKGILLGGIVRLTLTQHFTWMINSVCHIWGATDFSTDDNSKNNLLLFIPTLGGSWHNTHHAFPNSHRNDILKRHLDPSHWLLLVLSELKLVTLPKAPSKTLIDMKLRKH